MKVLITIILFSPLLLFAQEKGTFKIELESNFRTFNLESFNETLNNKKYIGTDNYDNVAIKNGFAIGINISYSFNNFIGFGIYGETQSGLIKQNIYYQFEDEYGNPTESITLIRDFKIQSFSAGLSTNLLLNNLKFWRDISCLTNFESGINIQTGYGKAFFLSGSNWENANENNLAKGLSYSRGFQLITSFKMGYILTHEKYFSSIGIKFGYQYFSTSPLKFGDEIYPEPGRETKLNFSGWSLGIYLNLGR